MKKKLYSLLVWALLPFWGNAQFSLEVGGGVGYNFFNADISNRAFTENEHGWGYNAGVLFQWDCFKKYSISAGMGLIQKNYSYVRNGIYTGIYNKFINTYAQLPLMANRTIFENKGFRFCLNIGGYLGYWAFARQEGKMPNVYDAVSSNNGGLRLSLSDYSINNYLNSSVYNRLELGWLLGATGSQVLKKGYSVFAQCLLMQAISAKRKQQISQDIGYNQTVSFSIGAMVKFKQKNINR